MCSSDLIEDLQHRAQVLRESAVLLGQRSEVLATKPWQEAAAQREVLGQDVNRWLSECEALTQDREWSCVDPKFPPLLQANAQQVRAVFDAFGAALDLAHAAAADAEIIATDPRPLNHRRHRARSDGGAKRHGAPNARSGAATVSSTTCWAMCTQNSRSA